MNNTTSAINNISPLTAFQSRVEESRNNFLKELNSLPEPLNNIASNHYMARVKQGSGRFILGEYAPWLIADLANISDDKKIKELMNSWLCIYSYIIFIDDLIDEKNLKNRELLMISAGLLLEKGITGLHKLSVDTKSFLQDIDRYFVETATAAIAELEQHRSKISSYSDEDISMLGSKVAVLKLCAAYMLNARGVRSIGNLDIGFINNLCTGIQLLDDITDWEEDWKTGNYTFPLTLTFEKLKEDGIKRAKNPKNFSRDEVLLGMIIMGSLEASLNKSLKLINYLVIELEDRLNPNSPGLVFLNENMVNAEYVISFIKEARIIFEKAKKSCKKADWLRELIKRRDIQKKLSESSLILPIIATES